MARSTTPKSKLVSKLANINAGEVAALSRLSAADTTSVEFGRVFKENPAAALATKGILISDAETARLTSQVGNLAGGRAGLAATEVEVGVKVKF